MSIEALKKAREALQLAVHLLRKYADAEDMGGARFDLTDCKEMLPIFAALAAIDAEAKPVVRMLTEAEFAECCGGCKVTSAAMTWMRRSVSKFAEVNGLTIGEQG